MKMLITFLIASTLSSVTFARYYENYDIHAGEIVVAVDSLKDVTVISAERNGNFVVQDLNGHIYSNISRSDLALKRGKQLGLYVSELVTAIDSVKDVYVVAIQEDQKFVVQDKNGHRYANITRDDLAEQYGCNQDVCAGDSVIAVDSVKDVKIVGVQPDGNYVLKDLKGNSYANISRDDLAIRHGRIGNLYVGGQAVALDSNKIVTLIGLQSNGRFVVVDGNGHRYANITTDDLSALGY